MNEIRINGNKYLPALYRIFLILTALFSFYTAYLVTPVAMVMGLYLLFVTVFIRTGNLVIKEDKFIVERYSIIKRFNKKDEYNYSDINRIEYHRGFFNLHNFIFALLGRYNADSNITSADYIIITKKNKEKIYLKRIGKRKEFLNAVRIIKKILLRI